MARCLVDSDVLIWLLRGQKETIDLLGKVADECELAISVISRTEIIAGMKDKERVSTFKLLDSMVSLDVTSEIADDAGKLVQEWRNRGSAASVPDALIAATVLKYDLFFLTYNQKHFPSSDIKFYDMVP